MTVMLDPVTPPAAAATAPSAPVLHFPHGLPGFPQTRRFRLEPAAGSTPMLRLRALDTPAVTFLLVTAPEGGPTAAALEAACSDLGLPPDETVVLFVAARAGENGAMVVNLRAPLLIDPIARRGQQYVLPDRRLPLRAAYRRAG